MVLESIRTKLIGSGYHPEDVDYSLLEILMYKKPESLTLADYKILSVILAKKNSNFNYKNSPLKKTCPAAF